MRNRNQTKLAAILATLFLSAEDALAESKRRIVINIADRELALLEDDAVLKVYPVAVGAEATPSPAGTFKIVTRITNPTWYAPHHKVVPPGKSNPLGTRWMGLSYKGYGIHGTNDQSSIGHNVSHGCIRMRKADVEELFQLVNIGDEVEMVAGSAEAAE
jgi:lipoprotein-anchoring transpeptidase ErfK/SrfK